MRDVGTALMRAVDVVVIDGVFGEMVGKARQFARDEGFAASGESIVITAGLPFGTPGATNLLRVAWVN